MTNLEYCNEILSIIGNVTNVNDAIYNLAYDAYVKLGGQETQPTLDTIYKELKASIDLWDDTDNLNITENGTYTLLGKTITVNVSDTPIPHGGELRIEALEDSSIYMEKNSNSGYSVLQYSLNNSDWININTSGYTIGLASGDKLYLRGKMTLDAPNGFHNHITIQSGECNVVGNLMYLYDYENPQNMTIQYKNAFSELFCYSYGLKSIELSPKILGPYSYDTMLSGCNSLNRIICYAEDISAQGCLLYWANGLPATGDFYNLGGANIPIGGYAEIPSTWTIHTTLN